MVDQPRTGRPPTLDAAARVVLADALERGSEAFGFPVSAWSVRDRRDLLSWWVEHAERVTPCWLPTYTPELNLIERVWRHLTDKRACHRDGADLDGLQRATGLLPDRLEAHFHQSDAPVIRPAQTFRQFA